MAVNINPLSGVINDGAPGAQAAVGQVQLGANFSAGSTYGTLWVNQEGRIPTYCYCAAVGGSITGDVFQLTGSATATVRITRIIFAATAGASIVSINRHSAVDTGGGIAAKTALQYDLNDPAPTAVISTFTSAPTPGTNTGTVALGYLPATGQLYLDFSLHSEKALVLRGTSDFIVANLTGVATQSFFIQWTEGLT